MGFPTDKQVLANTDVGMIEKALEKAKNVGIVSADISVENAKKHFGIFSGLTFESKLPLVHILTSANYLINLGLRRRKSRKKNLKKYTLITTARLRTFGKRL